MTVYSRFPRDSILRLTPKVRVNFAPMPFFPLFPLSPFSPLSSSLPLLSLIFSLSFLPRSLLPPLSPHVLNSAHWFLLARSGRGLPSSQISLVDLLGRGTPPSSLSSLLSSQEDIYRVLLEAAVNRNASVSKLGSFFSDETALAHVTRLLLLLPFFSFPSSFFRSFSSQSLHHLFSSRPLLSPSRHSSCLLAAFLLH